MSLKLFLILTVVAISVAEAEAQFAIARVNGTLYCSANGSTPDANGNATPIFRNARVQVVCSPDVVPTTPTPARATTNANGMYLVVLIPRRNATINSIAASCRIYVLTPLSNCNPTLPPTGLGSNIRFVGARLPTIPWFIRTNYFAATGFTLQA